MTEPLYMDNHLLALDKPAGLLTQPSGTDQDSLEQQGKDFLKTACNKPGKVFLEAVHRIDRPTCGVVLFARTSKALSRLNDAMRKGLCRKTYRAILQGQPNQEQGHLEDWLVHDDFHAQVVAPHAPDARLCSLDYTVIRKLPHGLALVEIALHTGRYHQIRAQFASRGLPVLGDCRYGARGIPGHNGSIALQHVQLDTPHPTLKTTVSIRSNINLLDTFNL